MNNPYNVRREVFDVDKMLVASDGFLDVDQILQKMLRVENGQSYRPTDADLRNFWLLWCSMDGRRLMEWWLDMTIRAPYPNVGDDVQSAAIAAARYQARASLGEVMLEALQVGRQLYEQNFESKRK